MKAMTDEEIARKVQQGDIESFGEIVVRFEAKLRRYAKRFLFDRDDTDDLVQDVFIKAFQNIQSFDTSRRFSPWIYRIAHNQYVNSLRARKEHFPIFDTDTLFPHPEAKESADRESEIRELGEALERSIQKLDAKYREPLILYFFEELDYKEISDILKIPISTVGVRLRRGKEALKKLAVEEGLSGDEESNKTKK